MNDVQVKPPYIGLLNAISLGETSAGVYLEAWANATSDDELAGVLRFVAARETSHGEVFRRRLCELGYELREKPDLEVQTRLARYANPKVPDAEKAGPEREERDPFVEIRAAMAEGAYDPLTCSLMQWYLAEEDDSGRRLREAYAKVRARLGGGRKAKASSAPSADARLSPESEAIIACVSAGFARLEKSIEKLARA